jgi:hypothetical protein
MAPKRRARSGGSQAADPRLALVGRYLGVPTSFFNVEIEGARYLARVKAPHKDKKDMLWMKFAQAGYGDEAYAPLAVITKWLISDDEALDPKSDWYEDPEDVSDSESEPEEEASGGGGGVGRKRQRRDGELRGSVKNGRWQPAQAKRTPHVVDGIVWRKASGVCMLPRRVCTAWPVEATTLRVRIIAYAHESIHEPVSRPVGRKYP